MISQIPVSKLLYIGSGAIRILSLYLFILAVTNNLGLAVSGEVFFVLSIVSLLSVLLPLGVNSLIVRASYNTNKSRYFYNSGCIVVITCTIFLCLMSTPFEPIYMLVVCYSGVKSLSVCYEALELSRRRYQKLALYIFCTGLVNLIVALIIYFEVFSKLKLNEIFICFACLELLLFYSFSSKELDFKSTYRRYNFFLIYKQVYKLKYIFYILLMSFFGAILSVGDRFLLGLLVDKEDLARYALIYTVVSSSHRFFSLPYVQIISQNYFRHGDDKHLKRQVRNGLFLLLLISAFIVFVYSKIYFLLGLSEVYFTVTALLAFGSIFNYLYLCNQVILKKLYLSNILFNIQVLLGIGTVLLNIFLIPVFGWASCAWVTFTIYFLAFVLTRYSARKMKVDYV